MTNHRAKKSTKSHKNTRKTFLKWKRKVLRAAPKEIIGCTAIQTLIRSKCIKKFKKIQGKKVASIAKRKRSTSLTY